MPIQQALTRPSLASSQKMASAHSICAHVHVSTDTYQLDMYYTYTTCTYGCFYITNDTSDGNDVVDIAKDYTYLPSVPYAPKKKS